MPSDAQPTGRCLNCDAALAGPYCSECGQRARDPSRPLLEILREFVVESLLLDGRLTRTLGMLLRHPGQLSAEFRHGRRARFTSPLRLYLATSLLGFSVFAIRGCVAPDAFAGDDPMLVDDGGPDEDEADPALDRDTGLMARVAWTIRDSAQQFARLPPPEQRKRVYTGLTNHVPRVLFFAMPVFAVFVQLLLWRRPVRHNYVDCLVFGLHVHALWFLSATLEAVLPEAVGGLLVLATMIHTTLAFRSAWELPWSAAWWRALALALLYGCMLVLAVSAAFLLTIVYG